MGAPGYEEYIADTNTANDPTHVENRPIVVQWQRHRAGAPGRTDIGHCRYGLAFEGKRLEEYWVDGDPPAPPLPLAGQLTVEGE